MCCGATSEEKEASGGKANHQLTGDGIEIDQLIKWIGWRKTNATVIPPGTLNDPPEKEQTIREVTEMDVERVVIRDFGKERSAEALTILSEYGKREGTRPGSPRVHLAILKFATGDFDRLKKFTEIACIDFRDVVGPAETPYPHFHLRPEGMPPELEAKANREQYLEWLNKK